MRVIFQTVAQKSFALCEYSLNASMLSTFFYRCRSVALERVRYKRNSPNASSLNANLTVPLGMRQNFPRKCIRKVFEEGFFGVISLRNNVPFTTVTHLLCTHTSRSTLPAPSHCLLELLSIALQRRSTASCRSVNNDANDGKTNCRFD